MSQPSISSAPALRCLLIPDVSLLIPVRTIGGQDPGTDDQQEDQKRPQRARHAVPFEQGDQLSSHRCDHPGDDQGNEDHAVSEEPDDSDGEQDDADQQPGSEPGVAKPIGSGEETGELARIDLDELIVASIVIAAETAKAAADHRPIPFMMLT